VSAINDKRVCCLLVACKEQGKRKKKKQENTRWTRDKVRIKVDEHKKRTDPSPII
jgi:hypothetical protein